MSDFKSNETYDEEILSAIKPEFSIKENFNEKSDKEIAADLDQFNNTQEVFHQEYIFKIITSVNSRYNDNTKLRKSYAFWMFLFLSIFTIFVFLIILLQGFKFKHFHLNKNVMMILVGTSIIAVIGMVKIVLHGLFVTREENVLELIKRNFLKNKK
ncbi:hypothetical protein [Commensalibacter melissae]|uniref:hypothetical protein n=1 Tax=Commensalibacter melissae TaxID=2070537 RepID=UPI0012D88C91|nr:hypothetical protein [Commensalibacter melissae]MUH05366.1 hypothetical protein [Commensalibacter melissae]